MILGAGIDIIEVNRIRRVIERYGRYFTARLFSETEIEYCEGKARSCPYFAARFAAKEAFLKALGTGLADGIRWKDIQVLNDSRGKPFIKCTGKAQERLEARKVSQIQLSITHTDNYAAAIVILE
ncbi:holo-ACP synthase [bacterium]|nr:holo-ACP synthase [bacterium]